ncbi:MAG: hypothetical protein ACREE9_09420, partial [Stellaceae bacterium]
RRSFADRPVERAADKPIVALRIFAGCARKQQNFVKISLSSRQQRAMAADHPPASIFTDG